MSDDDYEDIEGLDLGSGTEDDDDDLDLEPFELYGQPSTFFNEDSALKNKKKSQKSPGKGVAFDRSTTSTSQQNDSSTTTDSVNKKQTHSIANESTTGPFGEPMSPSTNVDEDGDLDVFNFGDGDDEYPDVHDDDAFLSTLMMKERKRLSIHPSARPPPDRRVSRARALSIIPGEDDLKPFDFDDESASPQPTDPDFASMVLKLSQERERLQTIRRIKSKAPGALNGGSVNEMGSSGLKVNAQEVTSEPASQRTSVNPSPRNGSEPSSPLLSKQDSTPALLSGKAMSSTALRKLTKNPSLWGVNTRITEVGFIPGCLTLTIDRQNPRQSGMVSFVPLSMMRSLATERETPEKAKKRSSSTDAYVVASLNLDQCDVSLDREQLPISVPSSFVKKMRILSAAAREIVIAAARDEKRKAVEGTPIDNALSSSENKSENNKSDDSKRRELLNSGDSAHSRSTEVIQVNIIPAADFKVKVPKKKKEQHDNDGDADAEMEERLAVEVLKECQDEVIEAFTLHRDELAEHAVEFAVAGLGLVAMRDGAALSTSGNKATNGIPRVPVPPSTDVPKKKANGGDGGEGQSPQVRRVLSKDLESSATSNHSAIAAAAANDDDEKLLDTSNRSNDNSADSANHPPPNLEATTANIQISVDKKEEEEEVVEGSSKSPKKKAKEEDDDDDALVDEADVPMQPSPPKPKKPSSSSEVATNGSASSSPNPRAKRHLQDAADGEPGGGDGEGEDTNQQQQPLQSSPPTARAVLNGSSKKEDPEKKKSAAAPAAASDDDDDDGESFNLDESGTSNKKEDNAAAKAAKKDDDADGDKDEAKAKREAQEEEDNSMQPPSKAAANKTDE